MPKTTKPKPKRIDSERIIANNPKIDRDALRRGIEALKRAEQTGLVKQATYDLEVPEAKRPMLYSDDE